MRTISGNQVETGRSIFYTLDLSAAQQLHAAKYERNTSRLACFIADKNHNIESSTFGLSDFMRPSIYSRPANPIEYFFVRIF